MSEVFISHSTKDQSVAKELQAHLESKGATAFLASSSIAPGTKWSSEILTRLRESTVVVFLASKDSCDSKYVNQEIGGSLAMEKKLVPILCGVSPEELPGWSGEFQAVEMKEDRISVRAALDSIADALRIDRILKLIFFLGLIWFVVWLLRKRA